MLWREVRVIGGAAKGPAGRTGSRKEVDLKDEGTGVPAKITRLTAMNKPYRGGKVKNLLWGEKRKFLCGLSHSLQKR